MSVKCVVCDQVPRVGVLFCKRCNASFNRSMSKEETIAEAIRWAATRAREFERTRNNLLAFAGKGRKVKP